MKQEHTDFAPIHPKHNFNDYFSGKPNTGQIHIGRLKGVGDSVWHTEGNFKLWCGSWHRRTPGELHAECKTIIEDLERLYPSLVDDNR